MANQEERLLAHELRKTEREGTFGITRRGRSHTTVIENKIQFSKAEEELLRSMALTVEDNPWQRIQFTNKFNSLAPTYDPTALSVMSYQNNTLRQCIAAMMANVDATGYEIVRKDGAKIQQVPAPDQPAPPKGALQKADDAVQKPGGKNQATTTQSKPQPGNKASDAGPSGKPDLQVGDANGSDPEELSMIDPPDVARIKAFWDEPYPGISFMTMRRVLREHLETTGNGYLEVIRDQQGKLALLNPMDAKLTRLIRHDDQPVPVEHSLNRTGQPGDEQTVVLLVHERRFVQIIGLNARFFKVYKATRSLNAQTGVWQTDAPSQPLPVQDNATEVIHFIVDRDVLTPYGIPRWINQIPSVMGSRKAEELNLEFFESGGVPPMVIMIQGGTLSAPARAGLTDYLAGKAKHKQRGVLLEIAPSGGDLNSAAQVKATIEKLGDAVGNDSKFEKYDDKCTQRVRMGFRLPPLLIGLAQDYNYATAQTAIMFAEEQVFKPERKAFDEIINSTIMKELDPTGTYLFKSKDMTAKFLDEQLKALMLVKGTADNPSFLKAVNTVAGLDLKLDHNAQAVQDAMHQQNLDSVTNGQPVLFGPDASAPPGGEGGGGDQASTGAGGGGASDQGGGKSKGSFPGQVGRSALNKSGMEGATAIDPDNPSPLRIQVTRTGKIRKLDHVLLTDLANDWAAMLTGEKSFLKTHVESMHQLVKSMTPGLRSLFAENVAQKVMGATHDPAGVKELVSCAGDVLARIEKSVGGDSLMALPKDCAACQPTEISKGNPYHDAAGKFTSAEGVGTAVTETDGVDGGKWARIVVTHDGVKRGELEMSHKGISDTWHIREAHVDDSSRGKGYGKALYRTAFAHADATGKTLVSDVAVSESADRVWQALAKEGFQVSRQAEAELDTSLGKYYATAPEVYGGRTHQVRSGVPMWAYHGGHVAKSNPYHDAEGKFTSAEGVGGASEQEYVYHGTPATNRASIEASGLTPNKYGNPLNFHHLEASSAYYAGQDGLLFRVKVQDLPKDTQRDSNTDRSWTSTPVPADKLEIHTPDGWKPFVAAATPPALGLGSPKPQVGEKFVVYRLGSGAGELANRNAGDEWGVAGHLARVESDDGPVGSGGVGNTISAYEVTISKPFGPYKLFNAGHGTTTDRVGREAGLYGTTYSFPQDGAYSSKLLVSVPLSEFHGELQKLGYSNFDDSGSKIGGEVIQKVFAARLKPSLDTVLRKSEKSLYVYRPVTNAEQLIAWAKGQGFETALQRHAMHVTQCYSKTPLDWAKVPPDTTAINCTRKDGPRAVHAFGGGAIVLEITSPDLNARWLTLQAAGATSSFPTYRSHITFTYQPGTIDVSKVQPYDGVIELGPEHYEEITGSFDASSLVEKSNPYHDNLGRFSSADGAGGGAADNSAAAGAPESSAAGAGVAAPVAHNAVPLSQVKTEMADLRMMGVGFGSFSNNIDTDYIAEQWQAKMGTVSPREFVHAMTGSEGQPHLLVAFRGNGKLTIAGQELEIYGAKAKEFERTFNFATGDVHHDYMVLAPGSQGAGAVKQFFANALPLYQKLGMRSISVYANLDAGGYAWTRFGFTIAGDSMMDTSAIEEQANTMKLVSQKARYLIEDHRKTLSADALAEYVSWHLTKNTLAQSPALDGLTQLTDLQTPHLDAELQAVLRKELPGLKQPRFVQAALQDVSWHGEIQLTNEKAMTRLKRYVGL